jgi:type IV secretory pathway VirB2 component (pilin)
VPRALEIAATGDATVCASSAAPGTVIKTIVVTALQPTATTTACAAVGAAGTAPAAAPCTLERSAVIVFPSHSAACRSLPTTHSRKLHTPARMLIAFV